jgi:glyoxylase-like metal-dependent hydrolase (beta-lactamase superfamily II)
MELAEGIHYIGGTKGGWVRAFLIEDGTDLTLIDTLYDEDPRVVLDEIRRLGRSATDLKRIVLTHGHRAHLGGLAALRRWSGATVCSHEREADIIAGDRKAQPVSLLPRRPLRVYIPFQLGLALGFGAHPPCPVDEPLEEGDAIGPLQVLHTPGHSPGHLSFYSPERKVLISGDAIATWPRFEAGWPAFTLNAKQHRESIRRLAALEPKVVGVGHGDPIKANAADRVHSLVEY